MSVHSMSERTRDANSSDALTVTALLAIAGLHVFWGLGSSFPFQSREQLTDSVIGGDEFPPLLACFAVASALVLAAVLVAGLVPIPSRIRKIALRVIAATLATRGIAGALGRTSMLSPGSVSPTFIRLDKKIYAPLCLWLAARVRRSI